MYSTSVEALDPQIHCLYWSYVCITDTSELTNTTARMPRRDTKSLQRASSDHSVPSNLPNVKLTSYCISMIISDFLDSAHGFTSVEAGEAVLRNEGSVLGATQLYRIIHPKS